MKDDEIDFVGEAAMALIREIKDGVHEGFEKEVCAEFLEDLGLGDLL